METLSVALQHALCDFYMLSPSLCWADSYTSDHQDGCELPESNHLTGV